METNERKCNFSQNKNVMGGLVRQLNEKYLCEKVTIFFLLNVFVLDSKQSGVV